MSDVEMLIQLSPYFLIIFCLLIAFFAIASYEIGYQHGIKKKLEDIIKVMSVEDMIIEGMCEGCDQDPTQCHANNCCMYDKKTKENK